ncbi:transglutaminase domain-containing protein [Rheinheimera sp. NSM]|uniref:transglutaminase domain-containing protein n=1 Tax=Rheinheimera sp. NSM TaxID=3457884 RepID=UPI00403530EC
MLLLILMLSPPLLLLTQFNSATELVKLRNAMVFEVITAQDANWTPANMPADFRTEQAALPAWLPAGAVNSAAEKDLQYMLAQTAVLKPENRRRGTAIQAGIAQTINTIAQQHSGYCADYTKVINALAYAAGVPVREWAISFDGFGGHGHAFNEVWDQRLQQWVLLDVFNGFYAVDRTTGQPLSVLAFRQHLQQEPEQIQLLPIAGSAFGFKDEQTAINYYRRGANQFALWWANNDLSYEQQPLLRSAGRVSSHLQQLTAIVLGEFPRFKAISQTENQQLIAQMLNLKRLLWLLFFTEILLLILLLICCYRALRQRTGS